jgi:hypothetical protein
MLITPSYVYMSVLTLKLMSEGFTASVSHNKSMVSLENSKGNKIYITDLGKGIELSAYKQTKRAILLTREDVSGVDIPDVVNLVKDKLNIK